VALSRFFTVIDFGPSENAILTPPLKIRYATTSTSSEELFHDSPTLLSVLDVTATPVTAVGGPESAAAGTATDRDPTTTVDPPTSAVTS
jgi:hypothetical protein